MNTQAHTPVTVDTIPTPNPEALMFRVVDPFVDSGTFEYTSQDAAASAALPRRLFGLDAVRQVLVTSRFVTVNKHPAYTWPELVPTIKALIQQHISSGEPAVPAETRERQYDVTTGDITSELAKGVRQLIDEEIRPAVAQDGGDVVFLGLTPANIVKVRLIGSCSSCPSATATLSMGIERLICEEFPEIQGVEQEI